MVATDASLGSNSTDKQPSKQTEHHLKKKKIPL